MKLYTSLLEKYLDLPTKDVGEIRAILDDVGLEVKDVETVPHGAVFNVETLANRGDHLSALGVARELSARLLNKVKYPSSLELPDKKGSVPVRKLTSACMRYALLEMTVPADMELRDDIAVITGADAEKRHAIVNVLNYAALELGQPMHAFDKDLIDGEIIVDLTANEETIEALDGKKYTVPPDSIVIKDKKKIVAVAGVIGCANSMVDKKTTRVLIESASFDPVKVRKTARAMGLSTDASYTFERGCDVDMVLPALKRVAYLTQSAGAHLVSLQYAEGEPTEKRTVRVRLPHLKKQMNLPRLPDVEISARLKNLGFGVDLSEGAKEMTVMVPSWRLWDVHHEEDIIEDFARSHGLNNVKLDLPPLDYEGAPQNDIERLLKTVEPTLIGNGFFEVITRSFYSAEDLQFLNGLEEGVASRHVSLKNSIESAYAHLKISNVLHFTAIAAQNQKMHVHTIKIFELGRLFSLDDKAEDSYERDVLCLGVAGRWNENEWRKGETAQELFYHTKGVIEGILAACGRTMHFSESRHGILHPGYQASIIAGREMIGFLGAVHPSILERYELKGSLIYVELDATKLSREVHRAAFAMPVDFPIVRRDITLRVGKNELAGKAINYVAGAKLETLIDVSIVDDFAKDNEDFRRVTYRLTFQHAERTLEHVEVDREMERLLSHLKERHNLELAL